MDTQANTRMREESGNVTIDGDKIVSFFYELLRDHLPVGTVESIVRNVLSEDKRIVYTNGWLANYAKYVAARLR